MSPSEPRAEAPDLRLAPTALGCWAGALVALHVDLTATTVLAVLSAVLAGGVARWGRTGWRWIAAAGLLGLVCGTVATGARVAARDAPELVELVAERATAEVELTVRDDPRPAGGATRGPVTWVVPAQLDRVGDRLRVDVRVLVLASDDSWAGLLPGQRLRTTARFTPSRGGDLRAAVLSSRAAPELLGEPPWYQLAAGSLRDGLQRACDPLDDRQGGLLPGLVVGDISRLDPAVAQQFRDVGLTHLVAVSGSNVAIIVGGVLLLARWAGAGPRLTAVLCGLAVVGFVILVRPSPSVLRAAAMGTIGLIALAGGRTRAAVPALAATMTLLLVIDPELAGSAGFALSVLATAGLLLLAPVLRDALRRRRVPSGVAEALAIPAAAQLACGPVVAGISGTISLVAIPANLLVVPAIAPATLTGVAAAALSPIWPGGAEFAAWLGSWPAWWLVTVAQYGSAVPAGVLPWPDGTPGALLLAGLTVLLMIGFRRRAIRRLVIVLTLAIAVGALPVRLLAPGWPATGWLVVACDVGQGDATVLRTGPGSAVVMDAGPEPSAVDACLTRLGVHTVPLVLISHFHADHIGGLSGVLRGRSVGRIVTSSWPEPQAGRAAVAAEAARHAATVTEAVGGTRWTVGELTLTVISTDLMRGTRSDPNNNSLLVVGAIQGVRILLTGDAETEQQRALLETGTDVTSTVLKVSHHGSAFQEPDFLDAVGPAVALVSVGTGNSYGHPSPTVLSRLARNGARVIRTDQYGDIAVVLDDAGALAVVTRGR